MTARSFVDTNILVYAHNADSADKHPIANALVEELWRSETGVLSTQVLQEFYYTITRKIWHPVPAKSARELVRSYARWPTEIITPNDILEASEVEDRYDLNFWDALLIITAVKAEAATLLSEDMQHGQTIRGVRIENPFKA